MKDGMTDHRQVLEPGVSWTAAEIAGGESRESALLLTVDQYVHVGVRQLGIDVELELYAPNGELLTREDSPSGARGAVEVLAVAAHGGEHRLRILALGPPERSGGFEAGILETRHEATADDRRRVRGCRAFTEAARLFGQGELRPALEIYHSALAHFQTIDDRARTARTWRCIGSIHEELGEKMASMTSYRQGLELFREENDPYLQAVIHTSLGRLQVQLEELELAKASHLKARELFAEAGDRVGEATALNNLGIAYRRAGEAEQALESYRGATRIWTALEDPGKETATLINMGRLHLTLGRSADARAAFERAAVIAEPRDDMPNAGRAWDGLGDAHYRIGEYGEAFGYLKRALDTWRERGDERRLGMTLDVLAKVFDEAGSAAREEHPELYAELERRPGTASAKPS